MHPTCASDRRTRDGAAYGIESRYAAYTAAMHRTTYILTALLLAATPSRAVALEPHQVEAIDKLAASPPAGQPAAAAMARHYAVLLWVDDYCNGRSVETVRAYLLAKGASDKDAFESGWMDTFDMLGKTDTKAMCALALEQYGPAGVRIRGAWAPK